MGGKPMDGTAKKAACWAVALVIVFGFFDVAHARKFDLKTESFATYISGSYGPSYLSDSAYGKTGGTGVTTDQVVRTNLSGELGVVILSDPLSLRLGAEYLFGRNINGAKGYSAAGVEYFEVDSKVSAVIPFGAIELTLLKQNDSRMYAGAGAGVAMVSLDQEYRMTTAGRTATGVDNYSEKGATQVTTWRAYVGGEMGLVDTTTISMEFGYRSLAVDAIQSTKDTTAISGTQTTGGKLMDADGNPRSFDLGGGYVAISFRFYL